MPNYKSTTVQGEAWNRWNRLIIENPLYMPECEEYGVPSILAVEEEISPRPNNRLSHKDVANLGCTFNPTATFPIVDPATDIPVGRDMSHSELYACLYSLTRYMATERDAAAQEGGN